MSWISMTKKVKKHICFHYLLRKIQTCALILLELDMFLKKYWTKSKINMWGFYLYRFHRIYALRKNFVTLYQFIFSKWLWKEWQKMYKYFKDKYVKSQFRLKKKIDEIWNYLLEKIKHNLMSKILKRHVSIYHVEHLLILASIIISYVSISAFASLVCVPECITSSAVGIKICAITVWIKKCNSIIKKKKEKHDKIVLLRKDKLNTIGLNF